MLEVCSSSTRLSTIIGVFLVAGTLEALSAMAHKHLQLGVASPFLVSIHLIHRYSELIRNCLYSIPPGPTPRRILTPIVLSYGILEARLLNMAPQKVLGQ